MQIFKVFMLSLCFFVALSGIGYSKSVFLRDGSELECESFRRQGNLIIVKVNRDVVVEFASEEVDLDKTFRKGPIIKKERRPARHKTVAKVSPGKSAKPGPGASVSAPTAPAGSPPAKPEPPAKKDARPAAQGVSPGAKENAPPPVKPANPAPPVKPQNNPPPVVKPPPAPEEKPGNYLLFAAVGGVALLLAVLTIIRLRRKSGKRTDKEVPIPR